MHTIEDTLKTELARRITALAAPEHKVERTACVDALEAISDYEFEVARTGVDVGLQLAAAKARAKLLLMALMESEAVR